MSQKNIEAALPGATESLVDFVVKQAKRVFATVLLASRKVDHDLVRTMESFLKKNFDDSVLYGEASSCKNAGKGSCSHDSAFDVLHDTALWDYASVQAFNTARWNFNVPVFKKTDLRHYLATRAILPFHWEEEETRETLVGAFSKVDKAVIHPHHQNVLSAVRLPWLPLLYDYVYTNSLSL